MGDLQTSVVRTVVPYVIGLLVSWLATNGVVVSSSASALLSAALAFLVGSVYYVAVRLLEKKWPKLGWLLGNPVQPQYNQK